MLLVLLARVCSLLAAVALSKPEELIDARVKLPLLMAAIESFIGESAQLKADKDNNVSDCKKILVSALFELGTRLARLNAVKLTINYDPDNVVSMFFIIEIIAFIDILVV